MLVRARLAYKRGEPRVCAMIKAPTPEEEDRRRLCRERKLLIVERVRHVNRVKGLLFTQGYLATSRCAATGDDGWIRSRPAMVAYCRIT
jgi:transposase